MRTVFAFALAAATFGGCGTSDVTNPAGGSGADDAGTAVDARDDDAREADSGDASAPDTSDARPGAPDAAADADVPPSAFSTRLSEMDLYVDFAKKVVHPRNHPYTPAYELWSDGSTKRRWFSLPPGTKLDSSDMDHWVMPIGARTWKEFVRDGKRLETRLVERTGEDSYRMGSYVWNADESEALWTTAGAADVLGTTHDVPNEGACQRCHDGEPGRLLGLAAIQLAKGPGPLTLGDLSGWLTRPAPADVGVPGDPTASAALGYLHANCAHCHNPNDTFTFLAAGMDLHVYVGEKELAKTQAYLTTVNQRTERYTAQPYRILGGDPAQSAVYTRMNLRNKDQMPTVGTEQVHASGLAVVKAWIDALPRP
jgi:hypothetical protein